MYSECTGERLLSFLGLIQFACLICFLVSDYINLDFQIYLHVQVPKQVCVVLNKNKTTTTNQGSCHNQGFIALRGPINLLVKK